MKRSTLLIGMLVLGLAACGDGPNDPKLEEDSSVSFSYHGPISGSFHAEGFPDISKPPLQQTYALGHRYRNPNAIEVSGILQRPGGMVDGVDIRIPRHAPGSSTIDSNACRWWDDGCPNVFLFLELRNVNGAQAKYSCRLETGTIRLTSVSETRAEGEFSGTGQCSERSGVPGEIIDHEGLNITNGRFEVNLVNATRG